VFRDYGPEPDGLAVALPALYTARWIAHSEFVGCGDDLMVSLSRGHPKICHPWFTRAFLYFYSIPM